MPSSMTSIRTALLLTQRPTEGVFAVWRSVSWVLKLRRKDFRGSLLATKVLDGSQLRQAGQVIINYGTPLMACRGHRNVARIHSTRTTFCCDLQTSSNLVQHPAGLTPRSLDRHTQHATSRLFDCLEVVSSLQSPTQTYRPGRSHAAVCPGDQIWLCQYLHILIALSSSMTSSYDSANP